MGGVLAGLRLLKTRRGDRMATFKLEDETGSVEVVVYPEAFRDHGTLLEDDAMLVVRGKFEKDDETARFVASEIGLVSRLAEQLAREVSIRVAVPPHGRPTFEQLADVLLRHRGDRPVRIEVELRGAGRPMRVRADVLQMRVRPSDRLVSDVEQICGVGSVSLQ
jgi:DNA polymerase-3 subunit alpha